MPEQLGFSIGRTGLPVDAVKEHKRLSPRFAWHRGSEQPQRPETMAVSGVRATAAHEVRVLSWGHPRPPGRQRTKAARGDVPFAVRQRSSTRALLLVGPREIVVEPPESTAPPPMAMARHLT
jgi:hypothetical protein